MRDQDELRYFWSYKTAEYFLEVEKWKVTMDGMSCLHGSRQNTGRRHSLGHFQNVQNECSKTSLFEVGRWRTVRSNLTVNPNWRQLAENKRKLKHIFGAVSNLQGVWILVKLVRNRVQQNQLSTPCKRFEANVVSASLPLICSCDVLGSFWL